MGNSPPGYKANKYISFSLELEKVCFFPGEYINGKLFLEGKPGLKETKLKEPNALFIINQNQIYDYYSPQFGDYTSDEKNLNIYENTLTFNDFTGANLLSKIIIPFSVKLPLSTYPSVSFSDGGYVEHTFSVEFPSLKIKRTYKIVVKNNPNFTIKNKLLKIPCKLNINQSKSKFLFNKGNYILLINLPKNVFYYDEQISYNILLDCNNLNLVINEIKISFIRKRITNSSAKPIEERVKRETLLTERIKLNQSDKVHNINGKINFPNEHSDDKNVYPPLVYQIIDEKGPYGENCKVLIKKYNIYPSCRGGLLTVEYFLKIKLIFQTSLTFDESINIPLDFCSRAEAKIIDKNKEQINSNDIIMNQYNKPKENSIEKNKKENEVNENITIGENNINDEQNNENFDLNNNGYNAPPPAFYSNNNNN